MKITPILLTQNFCSNKNLSQDNKKLNINLTTTEKCILAGGAVLALACVGKALIKPNKIINASKDFIYKSNILESAGIKKSPDVLNSIVGPDELRELLTQFGDNPLYFTARKTLNSLQKDEGELVGVANKTFRINLHNHTTCSDGRLSVQDFLDKSANYADEVAKTLDKNSVMPNAPYTIAITDHDTIEGCKEAVKIISNNPDKYKNLRVVLGCEFTTENKMVKQELNKPVSLHMLVSAINPFDESLNTFINSKKANKINLVQNLIEKSSEKIKEIFPELTNTFSYEETKALSPSLREGIISVDYPTRSYLQFKTIFEQCFKNNPFIKTKLTEKNINISDITYLLSENEHVSGLVKYNPSYSDYFTKLQQYAKNLLNLSDTEISKNMKFTDKLEKAMSEIEQITNAEKPKLDLQNAYIGMDELINMAKGQQTGYLTIAHPGLINVGSSLKKPEESCECIKSLFENFANTAGERALAAEINYPYFGQLVQSSEWLKLMLDCAKNNKLLLSGGLDTHGKNIFYSTK